MEIYNSKIWVIMSKDRKFIAKGTPKNRCLVRVDDKKDRKRFLTYKSKGMAESGFKKSGFYGQDDLEGYKWGTNIANYLDAVECEMVIKTTDN